MRAEEWKKILDNKEVQEAINAGDIPGLVKILRLGFDFSDYDISQVYTALQSAGVEDMPIRSQIIGQVAFVKFCKGLEVVLYAGGVTYGRMDQEEYKKLLKHDGEIATIYDRGTPLYSQRDRFSMNFLDSYWKVEIDGLVIEDVSGRALRLIALAPQ